MDKKNPQLSSAFRLGMTLEGKAAMTRKHYALEYLRSHEASIPESRLSSLLEEDADVRNAPIQTLLERIRALFPLRLTYAIEKLAKADSDGLGNMDLNNLALLHAGINGLIDEGTYLWNVHRVFQDLLKSEKNPRSLQSTLTQIGPFIDALPQPDDLKKDFEKLHMAQNRILNDLTFIDVHELIGDDPQDHFSNIMDFFLRQKNEILHLTELATQYLTVFESYIDELLDQEWFDYEL